MVTEVLEPSDIEATRAVCDMLQIGLRNMTNTPLLREAGRAGMPVLLKRGMTATSKALSYTHLMLPTIHSV